MGKLVALLFNSGLMVVVLLMLSTPLLMGQLLATYETGALGAATSNGAAATQSASASSFAVYPNVADFADYAQFSDQPEIGNNLYQTSVTFTAFSGQQAAYNALFTIYNTSNAPLNLTLKSGTISGEVENARVLMSLVRDGQVGSTLVTESTTAEATELRVGQSPESFVGPMVVGDDVVEAASSNQTAVKLANKLVRDVSVGEKVYFSPLYYNQSNQPLLAASQAVTLHPQQKAVVNLNVATEASETDTTQLVLPLVISAK